jgi:predicted RND superfamily exporter protein
MNRYAVWVLRHRLAIIVLTLLATAALGWLAAGIRVVIDPAALAPQGHPYVAATNRVEAVFGSKYLMIIGLTPRHGDALQPEVLQRVERLTRALDQSPAVVRSTILSLAARQAKGIRGSDGLLEVRPLLPGGTVTPAAQAGLRRTLIENPVYLGTVVSADFRTAAVLVELKERKDGFQAMVDPVRRIAEGVGGAEVDVVLGGNPVYLAQTEAYAQRILLLFPVALLVIGLLHLEAFRTWQGLVLPLVTAVMAVVWSLGVMGLLHQPLDIFNAPAPILILAVAAGHAVQLLKRYYEEYGRLLAAGAAPTPATNRQAVLDSMTRVGPVMVIAGGVAALGLFSLTVFAIPTVRTFGIFTGMGIVSAVLLEMSFIPAVRSLLRPPRRHEMASESRLRAWDRIPAWVAARLIDARRRRKVFAGLTVFVLACAMGASSIVVDNASRNYFAAYLPIQRDDAFLNRQLGGTNSLYIMVEGEAGDAIKSPALLAGIEHLQRVAEAEPQVGKTLSIVDYVRRMHRAMNADAAGADRLPQDAALVSQYLLMYDLSGEPGDFGAFVDHGYRRAKITVMLRTGSNRYIKGLVERLEAEARHTFGPSVRVSFGGDVTQTIALTDTMVGSKLLNIVQVSLAIFGISALVFRSLTAGVIVLAPLSVAVLAVFGVMGALSIPLNIPNSLIAAMAAGIGGDYAIYLLYRIREQVRAGATPEQAVTQGLATAGKASLYVATAVAGGYGVLALSIGFNVHLWTALFIGVAMLASVGASLTLVPGLVLAWRPRCVFGPTVRGPVGAPVVLAVALGCGAALLAPDARADATPDALAIMQRSAEASRVKDSVANATFTLTHRDGTTQVRRITGLTRLQDNGQDVMRLMRFQSPVDIKGTSTLLVEHAAAEDELWVYLPALSKVRRLSVGNKREGFFGTDFSYGDIIGHAPARWSHRLLREEAVDGTPCHLVESTPGDDKTRDNTGYSRRLSWIDLKTRVALQVDVWDLAGQPLKRIVAHEVQPVGQSGRYQAMLLVAENLQTGHRTTIRFENFKADVGVDARQFTPQRLEP